jgi:hypothetical protein
MVFLNLERDQYSCVEMARLEPLARSLVARGLLCNETDDSKPFLPTAFIPVRHDLGASQWMARGKVSAADVRRFLASTMRAAWRLRHRALIDIVAHWRQRTPDIARSGRATREMRRQVIAFQFLRPWFPREFRCLFDSLALLEMLAACHLRPSWVFGVRAEPFEAHCWLQQDDIVLNDFIDYVSGFTPILIV